MLILILLLLLFIIQLRIFFNNINYNTKVLILKILSFLL